MIPVDKYTFRYIGHRDTFTEEEERKGRETREGFERCFLPPGEKLIPYSGKKNSP